MASGSPVPRPFNLRFLGPFLCRTDENNWRTFAIFGAALAAMSTGVLCPDWKTGLAAAVMLLALPSTRFNLKHPILVDLPALGLATWAAALAHHNILWLAIPIAVFAGLTKETAPVFAAAFALNPWLLVGLVGPAVMFFANKPGPDPVPGLAWIQEHPFKAGWEFHKGLYLSGMMLAPWGGAIIGLANLDWAAATALVLGYGQLVVATDTVRLYQWAAPALLVCAVTAVPPVWLPVLVAWTIWNPLASDGV